MYKFCNLDTGQQVTAHQPTLKFIPNQVIWYVEAIAHMKIYQTMTSLLTSCLLGKIILKNGDMLNNKSDTQPSVDPPLFEQVCKNVDADDTDIQENLYITCWQQAQSQHHPVMPSCASPGFP